MAIQFGKTWWGEHWLRSLENADYDNRLPRGAAYARSGHVQSVKMNDNTIMGKVSGSRPSPYKVTIIVPPFFKDQIEILMQKIIARPVLISKLLNRELDPAILDIAEQAGLKVFPRQWTDFKMQCSCPDWAVPCKHLASVIYMVSREIDNDPFLVFKIHHVDLIEELKKRGIFIAEQKRYEIPTMASLLKPIKKATQTIDHEAVYRRVDFSLLRDIAAPLVHLLPDKPPFYPGGNFRDKYAAQFIRLGKEAQRIINKKRDFSTLLGSVEANHTISHHTQIYFDINRNNEVHLSVNDSNIKKLPDLLPALFHLHPDYLPDYQPSIAAAHQILFASIHLVANGNIVPQIVQLENKLFVIRWIPAMIDTQVRALVQQLSERLPTDLLQTTKNVRGKEKLVSVENQTTELLSLFISYLIKRLSKQSTGDLFEDMFFKNKAYAFAGVGENALSGGIKVWLDRYFLTAEVHKPLITVTEIDDNRFDITLSIEDTSDPNRLPIPLSKILKEKQFEKKRFKILRSVSLLSPFIRGLDEYVNQGGLFPIRLDIKEFAPFLMEVLPAIRLLDIQVLLPRSLQNLLRPKTSVRLKRKSDQQGFIRLDELLTFDWQIALGDTVLSPEDFKKLIKNASGLFRFKENYIYVSENEMEKIYKTITDNKPLNSYQLLQTALSEEYEGAPVSLTDEVRDLISELTSCHDIPLPQGLNATLRPYQHRGYSWMYRNSRIGFGSIIADDMGLGKTLQVISILLKAKEEVTFKTKYSALVVVPTGLVTNWQTEMAKFAPSLSLHLFHGQARDLKQFNADVMLTTYGVLRSDSEILRKRKWQVMVIDEAQNIKNYDTAQAKAVKSIPAKIRIAMSGTPVENRLSEFWSIMDYTNKGYLGNIRRFKEDFATPIQVFNDEHAVSKFRKITSPFMIRRMKSDKTIISDLPDKVEQNQFAWLTEQQAALYQKTMQAAMEEIEGYSETADKQSLFKRQGLVLQMILEEKQICNHPTSFLKNNRYDASLSGKTELLFELLDTILSSGEKVLIFTQFKEMGDMLERFITERFGNRPMFYHGACSIEQRKNMVERFQTNRADKIFILSLKAAGTGLNLTAASHIIHYDLWWNPAVENQATDRAYRIGQKKNVMVHRLITKNTFEEKIDEMIQHKKHLAEMTVASGENWIGKLSNKELREIFGSNHST